MPVDQSCGSSVSLPEQFTDPVAQHGEGPVWSPSWGGLRWVDLLAGDVLGVDDAGVIQRWHVGRVAAALRPRRSGGAIIATEHAFVVADEIGGALRSVAAPVTDPGVRFNDGACDPAGNFLCGTMAYDETEGAGALYRLRPDGTVETVLDSVTISNGLCWTRTGDLAYYVDTPTGQIDVFYSDGNSSLSDRRPFATVDSDVGHPDGLTVDAYGGVWVALWGGSAVQHYDAWGRLVETIPLPARNVTACTFGGPALQDLYITTSRKGDDDPHPTSGSVFRILGAGQGLPVLAFDG
jgi:sugar lactone lactonase YvrE